MKLHPIKDDRRGRLWCGPAAVAAITGQPTSQAVEGLKAVLGKRAIMGLRQTDLGYYLQWEGYTVGPWRPVLSRPTLAAWLRNRSPQLRQSLVVVVVGNHYITVKGNKLVDNHTLAPVWIRDAPHRRKRVRSYMIIVEKRKAAA